MNKHEVFTPNAHDAREIAERFNGSIHAYNIASDEQYYMVTFLHANTHKTIVKKLMQYEFEEIITEKV